jgi:two-component SAPR family response regulator
MTNEKLSQQGKILIVEDDLLVALDTTRLVEQLGWEVIGPASSVAMALSFLLDIRPDVALLDINLRGEWVTPVAHHCSEQGIPFVLVTGYGRLDLGESLLQSAPRIRKPYDSEDLRRELEKAVNGRL